MYSRIIYIVPVANIMMEVWIFEGNTHIAAVSEWKRPKEWLWFNFTVWRSANTIPRTRIVLVVLCAHTSHHIHYYGGVVAIHTEHTRKKKPTKWSGRIRRRKQRRERNNIETMKPIWLISIKITTDLHANTTTISNLCRPFFFSFYFFCHIFCSHIAAELQYHENCRQLSIPKGTRERETKRLLVRDHYNETNRMYEMVGHSKYDESASKQLNSLEI